MVKFVTSKPSVGRVCAFFTFTPNFISTGHHSERSVHFFNENSESQPFTKNCKIVEYRDTQVPVEYIESDWYEVLLAVIEYIFMRTYGVPTGYEYVVC